MPIVVIKRNLWLLYVTTTDDFFVETVARQQTMSTFLQLMPRRWWRRGIRSHNGDPNITRVYILWTGTIMVKNGSSICTMLGHLTWHQGVSAFFPRSKSVYSPHGQVPGHNTSPRMVPINEPFLLTILQCLKNSRVAPCFHCRRIPSRRLFLRLCRLCRCSVCIRIQNE